MSLGSPKIDLRKHLEALFSAPSTGCVILDVPELRHLMIDGAGDPNISATYGEAIATLFPVAYAIKFASKRQLGRDHVVPPLEALWWADDSRLKAPR